MRLSNTKWPRCLVPNCVSKPSAVWPNGVAITPALAITTSKGSPFSSSPSAQARTLFRLARSSSISSRLPPLASASFRTCLVAALALLKFRAAPTTCAPCAARERAVSTPRPAETPVTRIRLPLRLMPDKTSSVVEVAPNEVAASMFVIFNLLVLTLLNDCLASPHALAARSHSLRCLLEIMLRVQICNKPRLYRSPSQPFLRLSARSRAVYAKEMANPAKMIGCFLARFADDRYVQAPADRLSDLSSRYALVAHAVIARPSSTVLKHEPVQMSSIAPMHFGPAVEAIPYIRGNALFLCDADQAWHKTVITVSVDRRGKPQDRCADSVCRQRNRRLLRLAGEAGIGRILFCCEWALTLSEQGPGSDDQRAVRARERGAEGLDGAPVRLGGGPIV